MQVGILGPLVVADGARPLEVGGARLRSLLIRLAADAGHWVSVTALADALWADDQPTDQVNALQSLVSRLRRALGQPAAIESGPAGYRLAVTVDDVDAGRFERLAGSGRHELAAGRPERAAADLGDALALWRGPALPEVADAPYATAWIQRLEELRLAALEDRADAELLLGRAAGTVAALEELVATHPLRERAHGLLMRALAGSGRSADALAGYDHLRRTLADELGLDPSPALQELHLAVLRGDPALQPTPARPPRRTNLRTALTSFVGREDDVQQVRDLLLRARLVTLVGAGGAGKTRLASEAARGLTGTGTDGVWMVELAPVTEPDDVPSAALGTLAPRETASTLDRTPAGMANRDALTRLVDALADADVVLVLDNCEHLIDAAAKLAEQLLGQLPRLTILATSREPLGIVGESLWPVRPLPGPAEPPEPGGLFAGAPGPARALTAADVVAAPAVRLFADRAALVRPGFAVTDANAGAVTEICRRLDGLPLAIELAAARLRNLPVETVAGRLGDRFRLLSGGSRTALPRHQTLRAVVAWSWELLTGSERRLAERLAVFPGGADAESAAAICVLADGDADGFPVDAVPDLLAALADKSLLVPVDGVQPRYRMLETIREFALERLVERGEVDRLRLAHARYFLELAERTEPRLRGPGQIESLRVLRAERDNLLAAMRYAAETGDADTGLRLGAALSWYWTLIGRHDEAALWLGQALAIPGERPPEAHAIAWTVHAISSAAAGQGIPDDETVEAILQIVRGLDLATSHPLLALVEPGVAMVRDDPAAAQEAMRRNAALTDPWTRAMISMFDALMAENDGDVEKLSASLPQALAGFTAIGDRWGVAMTLSAQATLQMCRGEHDAAIEALMQAHELLTNLQATDDTTFLLVRTGLLRWRQGDLAGARRDVDRALRSAVDTGALVGIAMAEHADAVLTFFEGDPEKAWRLAEHALRSSQQATIAAPQMAAAMRCSLAMFAIRAGDLATAREQLTGAYGAAISTRDMPVAAIVANGVADLLLARGDAAGAAELLGTATRLRGMDDVGDPEARRISAGAEAALGTGAYTAARARPASMTRGEALEVVRTALRIEAAAGAHGQVPGPVPADQVRRL